ncbi:MAG: trehalose utilization protein ThuA [Clostridiales bacterium]|nr:trehalose utilization protein ThuA [Clostridiales bacterium]
MIRVTVWNENVQERWDVLSADKPEDVREHLSSYARDVRKVHPNGIHNTIAGIFEGIDDITVRTVTMDMPENGLTDEVLNETDVLIWWAHVAHDEVSEEVAEKVHQRVLQGMGFIALHSAHLCKPLKKLLGTSCTLQWREGDFCRVWNTMPDHPIAQGVDPMFELEPEEMYGEFFDIPQPDELIYISWFRGGEVFRSGCTWHRGYGKIFYFEPGHETYPSYHNENVRKVILNAVRWANPTRIVAPLSCPHAEVSPEAKYQK